VSDDPDYERRKRWRTYWAAQREAWRTHTYNTAPMPDDLIDLTCGARTRAGTPCKLAALYDGGRCKWHGGCSTGPKTEAGKEQARINGRKGGRPAKREPKS
jgi:hypothetical protein